MVKFHMSKCCAPEHPGEDIVYPLWKHRIWVRPSTQNEIR